MIDLRPAASPIDALPLVREDFNRIVEESDGAVSWDRLVEAIATGKAGLWLIVDGEDYLGCVITEIVQEPKHLWVHIVGIRVHTGANGAFRGAIAQLSEWAHGFGARLSGTSRRPGMGRHLAKLGWEPRFTEYVEPQK